MDALNSSNRFKTSLENIICKANEFAKAQTKANEPAFVISSPIKGEGKNKPAKIIDKLVKLVNKLFKFQSARIQRRFFIRFTSFIFFLAKNKDCLAKQLEIYQIIPKDGQKRQAIKVI